MTKTYIKNEINKKYISDQCQNHNYQYNTINIKTNYFNQKQTIINTI